MKKILIVEDEPLLRDAYEKILSMEGFDVATASDGDLALKRLEKFKPDLILLDILMPRMDGLTFLEQAQIPQKHPTIKVVALSNLSDQLKLEAMLKLGASSHLLKASLSPKELVQHVRRFLR